jgi:ketosteroid isomerase-like protein
MYAKRDMREFAALLHPEAELHQPPEWAEPDVFRGRDGFVRGTFHWLKDWQTFRFLPEEVEDLGEDRVLVSITLLGRAADGGEREERVVHLWCFRDGQPFSCQVFFKGEDARAAADSAVGPE